MYGLKLECHSQDSNILYLIWPTGWCNQKPFQHKHPSWIHHSYPFDLSGELPIILLCAFSSCVSMLECVLDSLLDSVAFYDSHYHLASFSFLVCLYSIREQAQRVVYNVGKLCRWCSSLLQWLHTEQLFRQDSLFLVLWSVQLTGDLLASWWSMLRVKIASTKERKYRDPLPILDSVNLYISSWRLVVDTVGIIEACVLIMGVFFPLVA